MSHSGRNDPDTSSGGPNWGKWMRRNSSRFNGGTFGLLVKKGMSYHVLTTGFGCHFPVRMLFTHRRICLNDNQKSRIRFIRIRSYPSL
ncbi:hypothetical protein GBA52_015340 [Prunus armeniaca]|nr:hypothetical protein GBA52_015340 [Prunus armeniaca]